MPPARAVLVTGSTLSTWPNAETSSSAVAPAAASRNLNRLDVRLASRTGASGGRAVKAWTSRATSASCTPEVVRASDTGILPVKGCYLLWKRPRTDIRPRSVLSRTNISGSVSPQVFDMALTSMFTRRVRVVDIGVQFVVMVDVRAILRVVVAGGHLLRGHRQPGQRRRRPRL